MNYSFVDSELKALIRLLDDPDSSVFENVSNRLVSIGKTVIPYLETEWEQHDQNGIQTRIEEIIHQIEFEVCKNNLSIWKNEGAQSIFDGAIITGMMQYPDQQVELLNGKLEWLRKDVWLELNDNLTSLEKVRVLNHIIYDVHNFGPYPKYLSSDQCWFMCNLLDTHKGSPTTMAILYKAIAEKLDLPIVGINLPDHFILGYQDVYNHTGNDILFYINPFSKGAVFGKSELERYIEKLQVNVTVDDLKPISNSDTIKRLLSDLKACYRGLGKYRKLDEIDQLLEIL